MSQPAEISWEDEIHAEIETSLSREDAGKSLQHVASDTVGPGPQTRKQSEQS